MSMKANPTIVGVFVLTAIGLAISAIIFLGNFKLKDDQLTCVAYFTGSLHGLDVGAPVAFRGVSIGRVSDIRLSFNHETKDYVIPVYISIQPKLVQSSRNVGSPSPEQMAKTVQRFVERGMKAQLKINSLLTGKLYVDLVFLPDSEVKLQCRDPHVIEIPTQASGLEQIAQQLESLPLNEILNKVANALDSIDSLINSEQSRQALGSLSATLNRIETILKTADDEFPGIVDELNRTLISFSKLANSADNFMQTIDKSVGPGGEELQRIMQQLNTAATNFSKVMSNLNKMTSKDSDYTYQLLTALQEIERAAESIRGLSDYLQQNPNSVVFGRGEDKK